MRVQPFRLWSLLSAAVASKSPSRLLGPMKVCTDGAAPLVEAKCGTKACAHWCAAIASRTSKHVCGGTRMIVAEAELAGPVCVEVRIRKALNLGFWAPMAISLVPNRCKPVEEQVKDVSRAVSPLTLLRARWNLNHKGLLPDTTSKAPCAPHGMITTRK